MRIRKFSSPFLGTFFQYGKELNMDTVVKFSSPFLGTFFQYTMLQQLSHLLPSFRPLSWGLSFNNTNNQQSQRFE